MVAAAKEGVPGFLGSPDVPLRNVLSQEQNAPLSSGQWTDPVEETSVDSRIAAATTTGFPPAS